MQCAICGIRIDSVDEATEEGWTPYFYDGVFEHEVACPACTQAVPQEGKDGELEVKDEFREVGRIPLLEELLREAQVRNEIFLMALKIGAASVSFLPTSKHPIITTFPDGEPALMLVAARLRHIAGSRWGTRAYLNMELLKENSQAEKMAA